MASVPHQHKPSATIAIGIALTIILFVLTAILPRQFNDITGLRIAPQTVFWVSRLAFWMCLALVYLYCSIIEKLPLLLWADKKRGFVFYLFSLLSILLIVLVGSIMISLLIKHFGLSVNSKIAQSLLSYSTALKMLAIVTAAAVEELIFRGYLISRLQLFSKSNVWPIALSSVIFGLAHTGYGTIINVIIPVFIGLVFASYYHKYRNIKVLIVCHFLIDFYALIIQ